MALSVQTNVASLTAQSNLSRSSSRMNVSLERLSTGLKINKAADNASGLVISEKQRAQISGLEQGIANIDRAVNMTQTAESGLNEINGFLLNLRQLAVDSSNNGALDSNAIAANQAEMDNLLGSINTIADTTKFGTQKLLNGDAGLTASSSSSAEVSVLSAGSSLVAGNYIVDVTTAATKANVEAGTAQGVALAQDESLTVNGVSISLSAGMTQAQVISRVNEFSDQTGVTAADSAANAGKTILVANEFGSGGDFTVFSNVAAAAGTSGFGTATQTGTGVNVAGEFNNVAATGSGNTLSLSGLTVTINADPASQTNSFTGNALSTVSVGDNSRKFQIGAFAGETASLSISSAKTTAIGLGVSGTSFMSLSQINVSNFSNAQDSIRVIDQAITDVAGMRGTLGAFQKNTLGATQSNLRSQLQNIQEAESSLRDTDFATEIAKFTNEQIRSQAATSILGLANQNAQGILSLLQG